MKKYRHRIPGSPLPGFTIVELLIASTILLVVIVAALSIYSRSNKVAVDQQMFSEIQHDVRSAMFLISRYARAAGVGLSSNIGGYFVEGSDAFGPGPEYSDSLKVIGNFDDPLSLRITKYQGGAGGGAAVVFLEDWSYENSPYACPDDYENNTYMIISLTCPGCFALRYVASNSVHGCGGGVAQIDFAPGQSDINPPGGLVDTGCDSSCWENSIMTFWQVKYFWLDTTGNPSDYSSLSLNVGQDGYLGIPNTLYMSTTNPDGTPLHSPLAVNIETIQFQYNGDLDDDGTMDGYTDWNNAAWTIQAVDDASTKQAKLEVISRIRQIRIWVLGRTPSAYVSVRRDSAPAMHIYRRPAVANSPAAAQDDFHRRFLLESTASIRNLSMNIYNTGVR
jgi:type II secretory pathway pseudopilin PulG